MICVPTLDVRMPRGRNQNHFSHCNRKAFVVTNLLRVFVLNLDNMAILSADTPYQLVSMSIFFHIVVYIFSNLSHVLHIWLSLVAGLVYVVVYMSIG